MYTGVVQEKIQNFWQRYVWNLDKVQAFMILIWMKFFAYSIIISVSWKPVSYFVKMLQWDTCTITVVIP